MDYPDSETTQAIDLAALRGEIPRKSRKEKIDLYEVSADNVFAESNTGLVRKNNEDSYACCAKPDGHLTMLLVADGIGGSDSGEIASSLCVSSMVRSWRKFTKEHQDSTWEDAQDFLIGAIENANRNIYKKAQELSIRMGTTIALLMFADRFALIANSGDSRVYRLRDKKLEQLSTDHTLVAEALAKGDLSREEVDQSPFRHIITRAIGVTEHANPQIRVEDHQPGDGYLLCSDGLTIHVPDAEIQKEMDSCFDPEQCVNHLAKAAICGGGHDNLTIISVFA